MCTQQAHARFTFYFLPSAQVHVRESHIEEVLEEEHELMEQLRQQQDEIVRQVRQGCNPS